jgi:NTE family protein
VLATESSSTLGLVLPGGGARAAYQVGVLSAIAELLPRRSRNPFPIITGTSAGAVNATELGLHAHRFQVAVGNLERVWRNFSIDQVFYADTVYMLRSGLHWMLSVASGGWLLPPPQSLFDNSPLRRLLAAQFNFDEIGKSIAAGNLRALALSAAGYSSARSVSFFQASPDYKSWSGIRRAGIATQLTLDHLMASVAVPFLFPPTVLSDEYYGDGSMRQATPFSPAIRLGANRLLVIGTRYEDRPVQTEIGLAPSFGQIFGYMLDALFSDGLYSDLERLTEMNRIVEQVGPVTVNGIRRKKIDLLAILPSRDLAEIARHHVRSLPRTLRVLLRTMGALNAGGGELISYLMFEAGYTRELIALGYEDGMKQKDELVAFVQGEQAPWVGATMVLRRYVSNQENCTEAK